MTEIKALWTQCNLLFVEIEKIRQAAFFHLIAVHSV